MVVVGPSGSDKTTSLLSALNFINIPDHKIRTAENPFSIEGGMTPFYRTPIIIPCSAKPA